MTNLLTKTTFFLIVALFFTVASTFAQNGVVTDKTTLSTAACATIAVTKMNVLYAGIENTISVCTSVGTETIFLQVSDGATSTKAGAGTYNISVHESFVGKAITININTEIDGKEQTIGSNSFRVHPLPDPIAMIGAHFTGGEISKNELLANPFIWANMGADFVYDVRWLINSYQVIFVTKGMEEKPIISNDREFSKEIKSRIESSDSGTMIIFDDLKASCGNITRTLNTITLRLK
jgi:hypothetical protein